MDLRKAVRDPWVWGQLVLILLVGAGVPLLARTGFLGDRAGEGTRAPGIVLLVLGSVMALWGLRSIGPNLTPGTEPLPQGQLVDRGAYGFVRHPIYLGIVLLLTGWAWWMGGPWYGIPSAIVSFAYFDRKAAAEERWLVSRFPAYEDYRRRVRKMLPRVG